MPRWLQIVLTLVLFASAMAVVGTVINATVPGVHAWLIEHAGQAGFWTFFIVLWIVAAVILYRARGTNPKGM